MQRILHSTGGRGMFCGNKMIRNLKLLVWLVAIFRICHAAISFEDEFELLEAVDIYLDNDERFDLLVATYGSIEDWDVSKVSNFANLFNRERNPKAEIFAADLSRWNMGNAQYLHDMFLGAELFDSDLSGWNVAKVRHFNGIFFGATNFTGRGLETWDVSSGRLFMSMFASTPSLRGDLDIRQWNVSKAQDMRAMFRDSNFGARIETNNLCGWVTQLESTVKTDSMFLRSECPYQSDPQLDSTQDMVDFCFRCPLGEDKTNPRPNVLFIMTDQQRFDTIRRTQDELSQYDTATKIRTPNLDRLSKKGAYFRMAYCQCSVCAPARTSLRTGCSVERTGIQHNELTHEYRNSPLFTQRVENLEGLDQILTRLGYVSEYYGKWHMPETLYYSKPEESSGGVQYNDYEYGTGQFTFKTDSWGRKLRRYLSHFENAGNISRTLMDGMQHDTYTGFPYSPIQIDSRYGYPTGTGLNAENGFPNHLRTQPNVCGKYSLSESFTPSYFNADIAVKALNRLITNNQQFFLTVSFHHPHPPMVPAWKHLDYYWQNRDAMFIPPSIHDKLENADYGRVADGVLKYENETVVKEWTAVYYALIEEIDEYVGNLLDELGDAADNTLIVFTSDHGEMLGAHGKREKNNFFEESSRVPLFFVFPDTIQPETEVDEPVSHLDVVATILDYIGASNEDDSDGKSLRPLIEKQTYNDKYEEDFVVSEWDYRKPLLDNHDLLDRRMDERPSLMVRKGQYKLMTQKLASSNKIDMMYDLQNDPFEVYNHLGTNAAGASDAILGKAEHLRCLLIEWMGRLDGEIGYYSDPLANYGEGEGDIEELRKRQSWPALDFWVGDDSIEVGRLARQGDQLVRNEFLYMGARVDNGEIPVSIRISGPDAALFSVDQSDVSIAFRRCSSVKITFSASPEVFRAKNGIIEAGIVVARDGRSDVVIPLSVGEQQDLSEILPTEEPSAYPSSTPSSTPSQSPSKVPTLSPSAKPSQFPSKSPSKIPTSEPSAVPSTASPISSGSAASLTATPNSDSFILFDDISFSRSKSGSDDSGAPSVAPSNAPSTKPPMIQFDLGTFFSYSSSRSQRMGDSDAPTSSNISGREEPSSMAATSGVPSPFFGPSVAPNGVVEDGQQPSFVPSDGPNLAPSVGPTSV